MPCARVLLQLALLAALALGATQAMAMVDGLDLGPRPTSGSAAVNGQLERNHRIIRAFACDDEKHFMHRFALGRSTGKEWPTSHMMAKAAHVSRAHFSVQRGVRTTHCAADEPAPDYGLWNEVFRSERIATGDPSSFDGVALWDAAQVDQNEGDAKAAALAQAVSGLYVARFGTACAGAATHEPGVGMRFTLTPECLMRQIRSVVTHGNLGSWEGSGDNKTFKLPGTDGLPCITALPWSPLDGMAGDWDMTVIEYSRLAHLIYVAKWSRPEVTPDADAALDKINRWLLTLRGGPATEVYNLVWGCGNTTNSYGSASDYVNDNDVYHQDMQKTVSGENDSEPSFWKRLWRFLRFLLIAAAAAALVGMTLGALAGLLGGTAGGAAIGAALLGAAIGIVLWVTVNVGGIEETENHLFMQNTSKYLKNKLMMAELRESGDRDGFDRVADENEDVRVWLLKRMQHVVEEDFVEYNAKPYGRYTHQSILNLLDYACEVSWRWEQVTWPPPADRTCDDKDQSIINGAAAVYDLSAAKLALGSHEGRRLVPFRRLVEANVQYRDPWLDKDNKTNPPRNFHDLGSNSDYLIAALQVWTASTQHAPGAKANAGGIGQMMWFATSRYLPHEIILDLAVDKSTPIQQSFAHGGDEFYSSGPRWLLTAGGDDTRAAQGLRMNLLAFGALGADYNLYWLSPTNDKGVGVPTTLMVAGAMGRDTYRSFLRFDGEIEDWGEKDGKPLRSYSNNRCVSDNFACGMNLMVPPAIDNEACLVPPTNPSAPAGLTFISSAQCPEYQQAGVGNDFFVAVYRRTCAGCDYQNWGFIEVVEASDFEGSLQLYQDMLIEANKPYFKDWLDSDGDDTLSFYSMSRKKKYRFQPTDEDFDRDCRACGTVVNGDDAKFTIKNPRRPGQSIVIDYSDAENPKRHGDGGLILDNP